MTLEIPHQTTFSRRAKGLGKVAFHRPRHDRPIHILVDSTGVKVHSGNMRKPPKNRAWRKLHLVVDANTGDVAACDLGSSQARDAARVPALLKQVERPLAWIAADSAYDTEGVYAAIERHREGRSPRVLIPPTKNAQLRPESSRSRERNRNIRSRTSLGKRTWHTWSGYSKRSLAETTMCRYKTIIGPMVRARTLQGQRVEARVGCQILNRMTSLGMPESSRVDERGTSGGGCWFPVEPCIKASRLLPTDADASQTTRVPHVGQPRVDDLNPTYLKALNVSVRPPPFETGQSPRLGSRGG